MKNLWITIILTVFILAGCNLQVDDQKVVLWTGSSELLAYAQVFNSSQEKYKVEVTNKNTGRWDIAIGSEINRSQNIGLFSSLDNIFSDFDVDKDSFYEDVLGKGVRNQHQILLPLSFDVDAFISLSGKVKHDLSVEDFIKVCQDFNATKTKYIKSAFSPLWNPASEIFFEGWVRGMINGLCGGIEKEKEFREKYHYKYYVELLETGRILFWHADVSSFYTVPELRRKGLDFRYVVDEAGRIPILRDVLWVGIPKKSANTKGAYVFIEWLMNPEVQQALILKANGMDIRTFGLAGGFSAIKKVNTTTLPKLYPFIAPHIPVEGFLKFVD